MVIVVGKELEEFFFFFLSANPAYGGERKKSTKQNERNTRSGWGKTSRWQFQCQGRFQPSSRFITSSPYTSLLSTKPSQFPQILLSYIAYSQSGPVKNYPPHLTVSPASPSTTEWLLSNCRSSTYAVQVKFSINVPQSILRLLED